MDRRTFLLSLGSSAGALTMGPGARAADAAFHVLYPGSTSQDEAEELRDRIAGTLGPGVARDLKVVRRGNAFVVIYDRSTLGHASDEARARDVAKRHDQLLRDAFDEDRTLATVVGGGSLADTWNIRYGEPDDEATLRQRFALVAKMLGPGVAKALVVEDAGDGALQLVYKRMGDREGTDDVARKHTAILGRHGLTAVPVSERFAAVAFDGSSGGAGDDLPAELGSPASTDYPQITAFPAATDSDLRDTINDHVQKLRARGRVSSVERTAWVVHDLSNDTTLAAINADRPMQAASMIKPFVALAFFHRVKAGELVYGPKSRHHMVRMIRDSSNTSTNWLLKAVGGPSRCHRVLHDRYGHLVNQLSLVEYIPNGGRTYRNKASANDHARLLRSLWHNELPYAAEVRRIMNLPGSDRLYRDVPDIPVGTEVYNKTGTTAMCCGDMGILVARTRRGTRVPYILVGIIERASRTTSYTAWSQQRGNVIRSVSGLTYRHLKRVHDLV